MKQLTKQQMIGIGLAVVTLTIFLAVVALTIFVAMAIAHAGQPPAHGLPFLGMAGMIVNKASLDSVFTGLKTLFNNALMAKTGNWMATAMKTR